MRSALDLGFSEQHAAWRHAASQLRSLSLPIRSDGVCAAAADNVIAGARRQVMSRSLNSMVNAAATARDGTNPRAADHDGLSVEIALLDLLSLPGLEVLGVS